MQKVVSFFKGSYEEINKVEFPSRKEIISLTVYVISVSLGLGLFISGLDYILSQGLKILLNS